jgi:hypothetical protein
MYGNVGTLIQDTSTAMATIIKIYLNDAYTDISRRVMWSALIDDNYTFESVANQAEYTLPIDFDEELFVANVAEGFSLTRYTEGKWWDERNTAFASDSISSGTPSRYVILEETGKLKLDPPPLVAETYGMPYKKCVTLLSGDSDVVVIRDIERIMETYAIGQSWAYKRQFVKADWFLHRYEYELRKRIGEERSKINQMYQFISKTYRLKGITRLTGDLSYDSI